ncbi:MAG TPA: hypothetical protein VIG74_02275, partial [Alphaproteobacteria bacterium]
AEKDPQNHYQGDPILWENVLIGERKSTDNKKLPVYLHSTRGGYIDADSARCGLTIEQYKKAEVRIQKFYIAATTGDVRTLKEEFGYELPSQQILRDEISKSIPHDMFCNYQGIMLGNGVVWFDFDGNPIKN